MLSGAQLIAALKMEWVTIIMSATGQLSVLNCLYSHLQDGWTALHYASRYGHLHIVRELVEEMDANVLATKQVC